ncbi:MAG: electron transfer flavoprotein subunit beta/FixA family protein [Calditrichaeota bacterium]|nr:electron transfer flavoprotein subunit beta/FixA family protein [Calditrichota bacterium]HQU71570.1 electron transfer flavoprotein subunit beta/FixA family protein [Calditrichia bacterium]
MNIAVCIKQTPDTTTRVKVGPGGTGIDEAGINYIINPYDEFAIEEALQLTEKNGGEVTLLSMGPASIEKTIREGLAMGAHKAIRLNVDKTPDDPTVTAKALAETLKNGQYDLIFFGKQAVDDDHGQMASLVGELLDLPTVTVVLELHVDGGSATAKREVEGGLETIRFSLPAVVSAQRNLNEPRYRSLKGIMQAKKKTIEVVEPALAEAHLVVEKLTPPPAKGEGKIFRNGAQDAAEVVRLLREEAKVI